MPLVVNQDYYLELNSIALACPAWEVTNVWALFDDMDVRGEDVVLPYASGRVAHRRWLDGKVYTLAFEVYGDTDVDGTPIANSGVGLVQHLDYLKANLGLANATGDGTVPAVFHRATEPSLLADVHFLGFKGSDLSPPAFLRTTFDIVVPQGWTEAP